MGERLVIPHMVELVEDADRVLDDLRGKHRVGRDLGQWPSRICQLYCEAAQHAPIGDRAHREDDQTSSCNRYAVGRGQPLDG